MYTSLSSVLNEVLVLHFIQRLDAEPTISRLRGTLLIEHQAWCTAYTGSTNQCGMGFFSQAQLSVHTLFQCLHSTHVQLHALIFVHFLKIPSTGGHIIVGKPKNTAHIRSTLESRMGLSMCRSENSHIHNLSR